MTITPMWKDKRGTKTRQRRNRNDRLKREESMNKRSSKSRDFARCRFPLCACERRYNIESAHFEHKSMGGNPTGDRNTTDLLMTLCAWRHRLAKVSRDRGTLRWRALTDRGADGPVAWEVNVSVVPDWSYNAGEEWVEVARELEIGVWVTDHPWQGILLRRLAEMVI
jgi:hypothetical protein